MPDQTQAEQEAVVEYSKTNDGEDNSSVDGAERETGETAD